MFDFNQMFENRLIFQQRILIRLILNWPRPICQRHYIFAPMAITTVIFDMDGLLIDSEPLWQEAGKETLEKFDVILSNEQYQSSTGLRTPEWIDHWFSFFGIDKKHAPDAIKTIESTAISKIKDNGEALPGVDYIMEFFKERQLTLAVASSSPMELINVVVDKLNIRSYLSNTTSAEKLPFGKPHPQVFIECAQSLKIPANQCLVFEDSFNGMIAAKAAKMKCVVIPHESVFHGEQWGAADLKVDSLLAIKENNYSLL
jgi:mannitol-1-/sugar-/sorbitol-6-/2-deoxyglucose-6-phosphatase